jgi:hypothetical protein
MAQIKAPRNPRAISRLTPIIKKITDIPVVFNRHKGVGYMPCTG